MGSAPPQEGNMLGTRPDTRHKPTKKRITDPWTDQQTDQKTDRRTHPLIESWLTTKNLKDLTCDDFLKGAFSLITQEKICYAESDYLGGVLGPFESSTGYGDAWVIRHPRNVTG